jgi:undecaprenyl diphosphate synthase
LGVSVLTLYAFSADNWRRPPREVSALMKLLGHYLVRETDRCVENGVRLQAIGRRDRLPPALVSLLEEAEGKTACPHSYAVFAVFNPPKRRSRR